MRITVGADSLAETLRGIFGISEPTIPGSLEWLNAISDRILQKKMGAEVLLDWRICCVTGESLQLTDNI